MNSDMSVREFEATYKSMLDEQLLELTAQLEDLVPEARTALASELTRRGKTSSDIEQYLSQKKTDSPHAKPAGDIPQDGGLAAGKEKPTGNSCRQKGPVPADWVQIPAFGYNEITYIEECMENGNIPFQLAPMQNFGSNYYILAVAKNKLNECVAVLKEYYQLFDEKPEPFSGECPACGTRLEKVSACPECGIVLSLDGWDAMRGHPFLQFLDKNGLGRQQVPGKSSYHRKTT